MNLEQSVDGRLESELRAALERARELARERKRSALLRVAVAIPGRPLAEIQAFFEAESQAQIFVHDGQNQRRCFVKSTLQQKVFSGPRRFYKARAFHEHLRQSLVKGGLDQPLPLVFAAAEFDFGASLTLAVPETMVVQGPSQSLLVKAVYVSENSTLDASFLIESLQHEIRALLESQQTDENGKDWAGGAVSELESKSSWCHRVEAAKEAIRLQYLSKVVLARAVEFQSQQAFDLPATLEALVEQHPTALVFSWPLPKRARQKAKAPAFQAFFGASPEILIQRRGSVFETHSLAGTVGRGPSPEADAALAQSLLDSQKDRREQALVTDEIERCLKVFSEQSELRSELQVKTLAQAQHLETKLSGTLANPQTSLLEMVASLHPTPAVGGCPRGRARLWLNHREGLLRGLYSAPLGWIDEHGDGLFCVAIRSALYSPTVVRAFAGAGIVQASNADKEWQETGLKLRTVEQALRLRSEQTGGPSADD